MARANGKLILLGEHAVVHGRPAIACALDRGVDAWAVPASSDRLLLEPWRLCVEPDARSDDPMRRAFAEALAHHPGPRPALEVRCAIALPGGSGLGCSAALGSAVLAALDEILSLRTDPEVHDARVHAWERVFHGRPSGVDRAASASRGVIRFRVGEPTRTLHVAAPIHLVVANSGEPSSTRVTVAAIAAAQARSPETTNARLDRIAALVDAAVSSMGEGGHDALGSTFDENHALLAALGVSTPRLDALCRSARAEGALGAKLTGGGGGGCAIALARDADEARRLAASLTARGADAFAFRIEACA